MARLSAGEYYRAHGNDSALGDRCDIRKNNEYRCLLKRKEYGMQLTYNGGGEVEWAVAAAPASSRKSRTMTFYFPLRVIFMGCYREENVEAL